MTMTTCVSRGTAAAVRLLVFGALLPALVAGCAAKQPVYDGKIAAYSVDRFHDAPKAMFANQVPVYPGAQVTDSMGSQSYGDEADSYFEGMCYWLKFKGSTDQVIAFYDAALPNAEKTADESDGATVWTFTPAGGHPADRVTVRVKDQELRITEDVQGGRHRKS
jgi:hypothetical protein